MNARNIVVSFLVLILAAGGLSACASAANKEAAAAATVAAARSTEAAAVQIFVQATQLAQALPGNVAVSEPGLTVTPPPNPALSTAVFAARPSNPPAQPMVADTPTVLPVAVGSPTNAIPLPPVSDMIPVGGRNSDWTPVVQEMNGIPMVYMPAGCFMMGSDEGDESERPAHKVCLSAYWMGETEVTNSQYELCMDARICDPPSMRDYFDDPKYADHPVVYVDWYNASAYAEWAVNGSLPTEAQWEYAARGPEGWIYPWGDGVPTCQRANTRECGLDGTAPVGPDQRPAGASWVGALDMAGNVWEWVADWYQKNYYASLEEGVLDPTGPDDPDGIASQAPQGGWHVIRGGGWNDQPDSMAATSRTAPWWYTYYPSSRGFRIVAPIPALKLLPVLTVTLTPTPQSTAAPSSMELPADTNSADPLSEIWMIEATVEAFEKEMGIPGFEVPDFGW